MIRFSPIMVGSGKITVSYINYKEQTFESEAWSKVDTIFLEIEPVLIDEVIINAQNQIK